MIDWLINWLIDWLIDWLNDWLIDQARLLSWSALSRLYVGIHIITINQQRLFSSFGCTVPRMKSIQLGIRHVHHSSKNVTMEDPNYSELTGCRALKANCLCPRVFILNCIWKGVWNTVRGSRRYTRVPRGSSFTDFDTGLDIKQSKVAMCPQRKKEMPEW